MTVSAAAEARTKLEQRRKALDRSQRTADTEGAELRSEARERPAGEQIASVLVALSDRERTEVDAIDAALARLDAGTWGRCTRCNAKIPRPRLLAMPEAHTCVACASAR